MITCDRLRIDRCPISFIEAFTGPCKGNSFLLRHMVQMGIEKLPAGTNQGFTRYDAVIQNLFQ